MFAELVPEEQRSTIYAFDRSFEVTRAAILPCSASPARPHRCHCLNAFCLTNKTPAHAGGDWRLWSAPGGTDGRAHLWIQRNGHRAGLGDRLVAARVAALASALWSAAPVAACLHPCATPDRCPFVCMPISCADNGNAAALSSALLVCMVVPWTLCLLFFTGVYRLASCLRRPAAAEKLLCLCCCHADHSPCLHACSAALDLQGGPEKSFQEDRPRWGAGKRQAVLNSDGLAGCWASPPNELLLSLV